MVKDDPELAAAHELLMRAKVIFFLGFGYHRVNVERLRFDLLPEGKTVFGTAYGITEEEQRRIIRYLPYRIKMGGENIGVLRFLRDFPIFE